MSRRKQQFVWVVMANAHVDSVHASEAAADDFCMSMNAVNREAVRAGTAPRIYYHWTRLELLT